MPSDGDCTPTPEHREQITHFLLRHQDVPHDGGRVRLVCVDAQSAEPATARWMVRISDESAPESNRLLRTVAQPAP
jgi:hypothetical protein